MRSIPVTPVFLTLVICTSVAEAQEPLQFNVPYRCGDGTSYIITNCQVKGRFEFCFWREEKNGQLVVEAYSERTQMYGRLKPCPVEAGAHSTQTVVKPAPAASGKLVNPPYLAEMPSPERVLQTMKTSDPHETALRQVWAFYELIEIIKTLSGDREFRGLLPDEQKIVGDYQVAQYKVGQDVDKAFPANKPSEDLTYHFGRWDPRFGYKGINIWQFFSESVQSRFAQIVGKDNAR